MRQEVERYKQKYERQVSNNQHIEEDLALATGDREKLLREIEELASSLKLEKEKQSRSVNEMIMTQKELKDWKRKAEDTEFEYQKCQE